MTQLTLQIDTSDYRLTRSTSDLDHWSLSKFGSRETHGVKLQDGRITCTCADYFHRSKKDPAHTCKHIDALVSERLITNGQIPEDTPERLDGSIPPDRPPA